ncbi:MAG TPA: hypothetical protein VJ644_05185 [Jiangellaceae bacterium]|nr:hypothetical protein [Jiangellaceae bacterium]
MPREHARWVHPDLDVREILVRCVGHLSLPVDHRFVHQICSLFADVT